MRVVGVGRPVVRHPRRLVATVMVPTVHVVPVSAAPKTRPHRRMLLGPVPGEGRHPVMFGVRLGAVASAGEFRPYHLVQNRLARSN